MDFESIKIAGIGSSGFLIQFLDVLPDIVDLGYGLVIIAYFLYQIKKIKQDLK